MTNIEKGTARLIADFNSVRDGETLVATFAFDGAYALPEVDERVQVHDPEGNECFGVVLQRVDDDSFRVRLDYETWQDAPEEQEVAPVVNLMEALKRSVLEAAEARARGVDTRPEREEVEDFTVSVA